MLCVSLFNCGEQKYFGSVLILVVFQQIEGKLQLVNLEYGLFSVLQVCDCGCIFELDGMVYILQVFVQCVVVVVLVVGSCLVDVVVCLDNCYEVILIVLVVVCWEGVFGMCLQLVDCWYDEVRVLVMLDEVQ